MRSVDDAGPSRRQYLAGLGSSVVAGLAGCDGAGDGDGTSTGDGTATATATGTRPPTGTATATAAPLDGPDETWDEGGPPARDEWTVTFQDDFAGDELDWDVWENGFGPSTEQPCAGSGCSREDNVTVADGRLVLTTTPEGADDIPGGEWAADWTTGAICTASSFQQVFGYFEAKAEVPIQPGALPAFWAWTDHGTPPEIDFYEVFGDDPEITLSMPVDCNGDGETRGEGGHYTPDRRVDETFHEFGCLWGTDRVVWFVEGEERERLEGGVIENCHGREPLFPILCTHVVDEGDWAEEEVVGTPDDADYPYTHEFEWVRVWQREERL